MRRLLARLSLTLLAAFAAIQLFRPGRTNPAEIPERTIESHLAWTGRAGEVFERACLDCHSDRTEWPWYSNVAPFSWVVAGHVDHARDHLNVSRWSGYDPLERASFLGKMCEFVRIDRMPLDSYTWIHRDAVLDEEDEDALCEWTRAALETTKAQMGVNGPGTDPRRGRGAEGEAPSAR